MNRPRGAAQAADAANDSILRHRRVCFLVRHAPLIYTLRPHSEYHRARIGCRSGEGSNISIDSGSQTPWGRRFLRRLTTYPVLKSLGIPAFMVLFFVGYFLVANHPVFPVTVIPTTALDRVIGFQPWSLVFYASLWIYVSLPPGLIVDRRELYVYGLAALGLSLAGMAVFFFWPTATPQPDIDWARYPAYAFLKTADQARNACPSLHVAFSVFSGFWIDRMLRRMNTRAFIRVLNVVWGLGIVYSTLATKQHVALDALGGAVLGATAAALHWRYLERRQPESVALEAAQIE